MPTTQRTTNCYLCLAEVKASLYPNAQSSDTADDTAIKRVMENASRALDRWWEGRHYFPRTETRTLQALTPDLLPVRDLLSVTTLKTDDGGDRTYETTWAVTDYDLLPDGALLDNMPYTHIAPAPNGSYRFPRQAKGVQLVGSFGYYDVKRTATATLGEDLDASETAVDVSASGGSEFSPGQTITIDSEQMHIQSVSTDTLTVVRGANGTTAAVHTTGATIYIQEYPVVSEAALILINRLFKRKDAPFGVIGSAELGQMIVIARQDPDVKLLMQTFRKLSI